MTSNFPLFKIIEELVSTSQQSINVFCRTLKSAHQQKMQADVTSKK